MLVYSTEFPQEIITTTYHLMLPFITETNYWKIMMHYSRSVFFMSLINKLILSSNLYFRHNIANSDKRLCKKLNPFIDRVGYKRSNWWTNSLEKEKNRRQASRKLAKNREKKHSVFTGNSNERNTSTLVDCKDESRPLRQVLQKLYICYFLCKILNLCKTFPFQLSKKIKTSTQVHWKYAPQPNLFMRKRIHCTG